MAIIYSYPKATSLQTTDLFIISRTPQDPDEISNFTVDLNQISSYILTLLELDFAGDTGTGVVDFSPQQVFNIVGTTNEIETSANAQTLQIGLPDDVTITNNLNVGGASNFTGQVTVDSGAVFNSQVLLNYDVASPSNFISFAPATFYRDINIADNFGATNPNLRIFNGNIFLYDQGRVKDMLDPVDPQDAATKAYVDAAVTGLLDFKGTFRADTGEILSGSNAGAYLYNCPGGAGTRVAIEVGDYYIVAFNSGQFYCSGDLLNVGDSIYCLFDRPADSSAPSDWGIVEGDNIEGSGTANKLPIWTDSQVLADSLITQTKVDGGTIFDLNAVTTTAYTPGINTKLLDLNSGGAQKFSVTQDGGGGVVLPAGGGVTNPGPSFNMGSGAFSNGKSGIAMGTTTTAFGNGSLAANFLTLASGGGASAFGLLTEAGALASAAFGNKSKATGAYSIASGQDSIASGQSSVAIGEKGDAQGKNSFVSGFGGTATANNAVKFGYEGSASGSNSAKFGFESVASGPNSFAIGDGTTASGFQSIATGDNNVVSNNNSFVGGKNSTVTGAESIAYGISNTISANSGIAFGFGNIITAGSFQSFVAGTSNTTNSFGEVKLIGKGLVAASQEGVYLGKYNDDSDSYNKFQIGNGSGGNTKSNSLSINNAGNIKIPTYGSGTVTGTATYNLSVASNGQIIETPNPDAPIYKKAVLLLSQSGLGNPVNVNLLENGLGIPTPFNWTRISGGEYNLNATGKFKLLKTIVFINNGNDPQTANVTWQVIDADNLRIYTGGQDGALTKASVEIRTYN